MKEDSLKNNKLNHKNQSGQSFIAFILLLAGIAIVSFAFMKQINGNTAEKWKRMAEIILNNGGNETSGNYIKLQLRGGGGDN